MCRLSSSQDTVSQAHGLTRGPGWALGRRRLAEHAARCRSCGVADGVVNQVGPSGTAQGCSELVKAHTPRRGRPSCRNTPPGGLVGADPWSHSGTGLLPLRTRRVSYGEVLVISWVLLLSLVGFWTEKFLSLVVYKFLSLVVVVLLLEPV